MKKYICYEPDIIGIYTIAELQRLWNTTIDQTNFSDFGSWLSEMEHMQILTPM